MKIVRNIILLLLAVSLFWLLAGCQSDTSPSSRDYTDTDLASIPLEQALSSGLPTLAEFGRGVCVPCKAMKPILEELATEYQGELNVVIVEVDDHMDQVRQYEIMAIPTQIVFDSKGKEITRHVGFWPKGRNNCPTRRRWG